MKGLLLKDIYLSLRYFKAIFLAMGVFLILSFLETENSFFLFYPIIISSILPVSLFSVDENDRWTVYSGTLPVTRSQFVSAKYLISILLAGGIWIISLVSVAVRLNGAGIFSPELFWSSAAGLLVLGLVGPCFLLPFIFRFGVEKGRIVFMIAVGALCAGSVVFVGSGLGFSVGAGPWLSIGICVAAIGVFLLSWRISIALYEKKDL